VSRRKQDNNKVDLEQLLEGFPWPMGLSPEELYVRLHDDHDGTYHGILSVSFTPDGDAWVMPVNPEGGSLRFRGGFGGGRSLRVHNALVLLALAIKLDNEERPDHIPSRKPEEL